VGYEPDWVKLDEAHKGLKKVARALEMKDAILREIHALLDNALRASEVNEDLPLTISLIMKAYEMVDAELGHPK